MAYHPTTTFLFLNVLLPITITITITTTTAQQPPNSSSTCNSIFLSYSTSPPLQLPPNISSDPTRQPYAFKSTLTLLNNGLDALLSWQAFVGFQHNELLVSASNAVLADASPLPGALVGNGTVFAGFPNADLMTAVDTAGDLTQMMATVQLVGTQFGVGPPDFPMPVNISLVNDGYLCPKPTLRGNSTMDVCCTKDPNFKNNITEDEEFLPRQEGDLTIMYDVTRTYGSSYWVDVTISNHNPLGRLDNWELSWDWMRDEFINSMKGAYPSVVDSTECIFGRQGEYYKNTDFANVLNCARRPTINDLPLEKTNDTILGMVPNCCRNGTLLPPTMDPRKSISAFQMEVYKMPPDLNRSTLTPPQNWKISGRLNPDYQCGPPVRVSPSRFLHASGLADSTAVASWQVVCNITQAKGAKPRCCVSFSAYYNESIIPCSTCACGCPSNSARTCSTSTPALLLPSQALLVPFENRTRLTKAWADLKHLPYPNPLPCGDNCGVSVNWHLLTDYRGGWSARLTVFNWEDEAFVDWFAAVQLEKAAPGFDKVYSFNGSVLNGVDNTIFMEGLPGLNYLVGESDAAKPEKDPRIPGKQQSVITFTKKKTPGINIVGGDGFPTKVLFNGEECSLPQMLPSNSGYRFRLTLVSSVLIAVLVLMLMQL